METQDAPTEFLFKVWPWLEANKTRLIGAAIAVVAVYGIYSFVSWQHVQKEINAGQAFSKIAFTPAGSSSPSQISAAFLQLAAQYPGTYAAQRAQLQAAANSFEAGNYADAQTQFQKAFDATGTGPLAATAALGIAASLESQNKLDQAITAYQKVTSSFAGSAADLPAEYALGRLSEQQGKLAAAESYYEAAARAGRNGGSLAQEAMGRAYELKARLAAAPKSTNAIPVLK